MGNVERNVGTAEEMVTVCPGLAVPGGLGFPHGTGVSEDCLLFLHPYLSLPVSAAQLLATNYEQWLKALSASCHVVS